MIYYAHYPTGGDPVSTEYAEVRLRVVDSRWPRKKTGKNYNCEQRLCSRRLNNGRDVEPQTPAKRQDIIQQVSLKGAPLARLREPNRTDG